MVETHEPAIENLVLTRVLRMNAVIVGVVCGLMLGLTVFGATLFLVLKGGEEVGPHLSLLGEYLIGYSVTVVGSLIGLAYGCILGFAVGYFCSWLYNIVSGVRANRKRIQMRS